MLERFSRLLDKVSEFLAARKGLLPLIGIALVLLNLIVQELQLGWLSTSDLLLHLGVVLALLGILLGWAL